MVQQRHSTGISAGPEPVDNNQPYEHASDNTRSLESQDAISDKDAEVLAPVAEVDNSDSFSAFSHSTKVFIVILASTSAFMSPFAINIYMPAVPNITRDLNITYGETLVSVTMYMTFQGLSPSIWGPLSDTYGRRPILICTFLVFLIANLGLSFAKVYWVLLVLRMLQACGASSAIAIGAGCISDVSREKERGTYMGYFQCGTLIGPAIGPVVGGLMSQTWHWHAVFFFLSAFGGAYMTFLILLLPESLRALVGDGSKTPVSIWRTIIPLHLNKQTSKTIEDGTSESEMMVMPPRLHFRSLGLEKPWCMYGQPDIAMMIAAYAIPFGAFTVMSTTLSSQLNENYGYTDVYMGLCYLPIGIGSAVGSICSGAVLDWEYARAKAKHGLNINLHYVRMHNLPHFNFAFSVLLIANGWCLDKKVHIAAPMILQFFASFMAIMYYNSINTVLVDMYPSRAASVIAALNIGRCLFGAVCVAVVQYISDAIGYGWTLIIFGLMSFLPPTPLGWAVMRHGPKWRRERTNRAST